MNFKKKVDSKERKNGIVKVHDEGIWRPDLFSQLLKKKRFVPGVPQVSRARRRARYASTRRTGSRAHPSAPHSCSPSSASSGRNSTSPSPNGPSSPTPSTSPRLRSRSGSRTGGRRPRDSRRPSWKSSNAPPNRSCPRSRCPSLWDLHHLCTDLQPPSHGPSRCQDYLTDPCPMGCIICHKKKKLFT